MLKVISQQRFDIFRGDKVDERFSFEFGGEHHGHTIVAGMDFNRLIKSVAACLLKGHGVGLV